MKCKLILTSNAEHCQQVYTGLGELSKKGLVDLVVKRSKAYSMQTYGSTIVELIVNDKYHVIYDLGDGKEIRYEGDVSKVDFYFKRSYDAEYIKENSLQDCVYPYGLNYLVYTKNSLWFKRMDWRNDFKNSLRTYFRSNKLLSKKFNIVDSIYTCKEENFEYDPLLDKNPKILFLTQLWNPNNVDNVLKKEERMKMNKQRVDIIRGLKKKFSSQFIGGLRENEYTLLNYPDLVVSKKMTNKNYYLKMMHSASICITTTGLEGSIGWKFAEYIAASKAVVTEKLNYELPGNFEKDKNYLEFSTAEECINAVQFLLDNEEIRFEIMSENKQYYLDYVKPDKLIKNTLDIIDLKI